MKKNGFRITVVITLFLIGGLSSCSYEEPTLVSFDGINELNIEDETTDVELKFTLNNPNSNKIKLKSSKVDISVNDVFVGTATLLEPTVLMGDGEHQVELKMKIDLEKSMTELAATFGMAILTNNLQVHLLGKAKGSMGLFKSNFDIDHTEKMDWNDLQKMVM